MDAPAHPADLFPHADALAPLGRAGPLEKQLGAIHEALYAELATVDRISVLAYDRATDTLKTFLESSPTRSALVRHEARLSETPSLAAILESGRPRVVNDLELFGVSEAIHTRIIADEKYRASYTVPMHRSGTFEGFVFFDSRSAGAFADEHLLRRLDVYAHLISATVAADLVASRVLTAVVKTAHDMLQYRDPGTGGHIDRMARYARLIAQHLAARGVVDFSDEAIERIFQYAPLHDIGKIATPDRVLARARRFPAPSAGKCSSTPCAGGR